MIRSGSIGLRARDESDVRILHAELYEDVPTRTRTDAHPWRPVSVDSEHSPFRLHEPSDSIATFSVVEVRTQDLAGTALLWGIDAHNRMAHLGISLRPGFRGRNLSTDVVLALSEYGFAVRGMQRLQIETLADNHPMIKAATRAGFTHEGTLRRTAWVYGEFLDEVVLGLLADEWASRVRSSGGAGDDQAR